MKKLNFGCSNGIFCYRSNKHILVIAAATQAKSLYTLYFFGDIGSVAVPLLTVEIKKNYSFLSKLSSGRTLQFYVYLMTLLEN